jgi:hypothetical protein
MQSPVYESRELRYQIDSMKAILLNVLLIFNFRFSRVDAGRERPARFGSSAAEACSGQPENALKRKPSGSLED